MHKGKLRGLILYHIDDFLSSGSNEFQENVINKLRQKYKFGKVSRENFLFTGLRILQNDERELFVNQSEYADNIEIFNIETSLLTTFWTKMKIGW